MSLLTKNIKQDEDWAQRYLLQDNDKWAPVAFSEVKEN